MIKYKFMYKESYGEELIIMIMDSCDASSRGVNHDKDALFDFFYRLRVMDYNLGTILYFQHD
jgi:hypothetical protein